MKGAVIAWWGRTRVAIRAGPAHWTRGVLLVVVGAGLLGVAALGVTVLAASAIHHIFFDRQNLPDLGPFTRFEFPAVGRIYDIHQQPLVELAREYRDITPYADIPPVVRDAILAAEDKRFFSHNGVDYYSVPRVIGKIRLGAWGTRVATAGRRDNMRGPAIFPQGGSTITQQLVRGVFLRDRTSRENSYELQSPGVGSRALSWAVGARNANMLLRKREEIRLSIWLEQQMRARFGSKQRAKEEIFARYASFVYMGNGQYGFARAAEYLLRAAPVVVHRGRRRQGRDAGGHRQIASRVLAHGG